MSRLLKYLFVIVAALIVLMFGIAAAVLVLFDPNEYRAEIAAFVTAETGREFSIDGDLGLRVLPCCAVSINDTRLGNPAGFEKPTFASVGSVRLGLQLLPLLFEQRVVVDKITLDGLNVSLLRRADGAVNWAFATADDAGAPAQDAASDNTDLTELSIAGVTISDATIEYRDDTSATHVIVDDLDVSTGPVAAGEPVDLDVSLHARDVASEAAITAELRSTVQVSADVTSADVTGLEATATITAPDLPPDGISVTQSGGTVQIDLDAGTTAIENLETRIGIDDAVLVARASGTIADERLALSGTAEMPRFSPRKTLAGLGQPPIETADAAVLDAMELTADWSIRGERLQITELKVSLDDTQLTGQVSTNYADQGETKFEIDVDEIDLDRYLAPAEEAATSDSAATGSGSELPVDALRGLDLDGRVAIGWFKMNGLSFENMVAMVSARNGVLRIDPSTADVYGGEYTGALELDVTGQTPRMTFEQSLDGVQSGGVLGDLYGAQNLQGLMQATISGSGAGVTTDQLLESMQGGVSVDLDDAVYKGVDIWYEIRKSVARIKGKPMPESSADPQTEITALGFAGKFADGVLNSDRLLAEIPFIRVEGGGGFDLRQNQLDYRLQARMLSRPNFPDADDLADLERVTIPITVTGDAAAPTIGIDLEELAKDAAVQKVQDRLLKKLGLDEPEEPEEPEETGESADVENNATDERDDRDEARDLLKKGLRDLFDK